MAKNSGRERQNEQNENSAELENNQSQDKTVSKRQTRAQAIAKKAEELQATVEPTAASSADFDFGELEIDDLLADALNVDALEGPRDDVDDFMLSALMVRDIPMGGDEENIDFDADSLAALEQLADDLEDERAEQAAMAMAELPEVVAEPEAIEAMEAISAELEKPEVEEVNAERLVEELIFKQEIDSTFETGRGILPPPGVIVPEELKEMIESKEPLPELPEIEPRLTPTAPIAASEPEFEKMPAPAEEVAACQLRIFNEGKGPRVLDMKSDVMVIGRHPDCEVMLLDKGVSREHVRLTRDGDTWSAIDLNSTNGSFLGYSRLSRKFSVAWDKGTELRVGPFALTWEAVETEVQDSAEKTFIAEAGSIEQKNGHHAEESVVENILTDDATVQPATPILESNAEENIDSAEIIEQPAQHLNGNHASALNDDEPEAIAEALPEAEAVESVVNEPVELDSDAAAVDVEAVEEIVTEEVLVVESDLDGSINEETESTDAEAIIEINDSSAEDSADAMPPEIELEVEAQDLPAAEVAAVVAAVAAITEDNSPSNSDDKSPDVLEPLLDIPELETEPDVVVAEEVEVIEASDIEVSETEAPEAEVAEIEVVEAVEEASIEASKEDVISEDSDEAAIIDDASAEEEAMLAEMMAAAEASEDNDLVAIEEMSPEVIESVELDDTTAEDEALLAAMMAEAEAAEASDSIASDAMSAEGAETIELDDASAEDEALLAAMMAEAEASDLIALDAMSAEGVELDDASADDEALLAAMMAEAEAAEASDLIALDAMSTEGVELDDASAEEEALLAAMMAEAEAAESAGDELIEILPTEDEDKAAEMPSTPKHVVPDLEPISFSDSADIFDVVDLDAPHEPVIVPELDDFLFEAQVSDEHNALQALQSQLGAKKNGLQDDSLANLIAQIDAGVVANPMQSAGRQRQRNLANRTAMVVFELDGTQYAVSVDYVLELSDFGRITPVPFVPEWVLGVTNLRGEILSVIDLRILLDVPPKPVSADHQMMIIELPGQNISVGVIVDEIRGYRQLESAESEQFSGHINDHIEPYINRLYQFEGQLVAEMKFDKVLETVEVA